uniref:Reverse transcriptase domain-containing protein n=1 Tax=Ananas comosus var. bracteatus TaxID=296719 RepID=A0A6V7NS01_ANACO|nr:unnamed protein product [Ananas comosus var. bracteatus]
MLHKYGFPERFCKWVNWCISTVDYSVLVNGEDSNWFKPTRGLWQGCPLSPYLFILAINALSAMFKAATVENSLEGIRLGTGGPILTHVLYADDLFVFSKATNNDIRALKMLLLTFCELPGDEINYSKSAIIFNRRMSEVQRDAIRLELNINDAPLQGKYLGNPFFLKEALLILSMGPKLAERIPHFGDSCPLCQEQSETRDHLFFHCLLSQQVWFASQVSLRTAQSSLTFIEWLDALINNERFYEIRAYCMHVLWSIWKARNDYIFQHKKFSCSEVLRNARMWTKLYSKAHLQPLHIPDPATINSFSPPNTICWVDGAWKENRSGGIGYLVVEGDVDVYCCAAPSIDSETALAAEIQAWYEAVKWLLNNRPNIKCSIYTDSTAIIRSCLFKDQHNPFSLQELERIAWLRRLLESNNNILIGWSSRYSSFSQHVDKLAKWCLGSQVASSWSSFTEFEKFVTPYHME